MHEYIGELALVRLIIERGLGIMYAIAFISSLNQGIALIGKNGLLPIPNFFKATSFYKAPSIFYWYYSDNFFRGISYVGLILSILIIFGVTNYVPLGVSMMIWLLLYLFYLSIVNVGQIFYSFGWESMLLEAGFFAIFLGTSTYIPSTIPILSLRWMLFRTEFGAGLIKLRSKDAAWRNLSALYYHYETQPLPNPLSWYFHWLPKAFQRFSTLLSHFIQLIVPFGLFAPQPIASIASGLIILHQGILIVSGNYSWLNWLTIILSVSAFSDAYLPFFGNKSEITFIQAPLWFNVLQYFLLALTVILSIKPTLNLVSKHQLMNYTYNPFHLVCAYGAFGTITKERYEIIIEGTSDQLVTNETQWQSYEFKAKPGNPTRPPPQIAPYHLRLDWLMWFLPFSAVVDSESVLVYGYEKWFLMLIKKLLANEAATVGLLLHNPFPTKAPALIRALYYRYEYTTPEERHKNNAWWKRKLVGEYIPPVRREDFKRFEV